MPSRPRARTPPARTLPTWAFGLANAPLGFYYGFLSTAMPILLAGRGVGVAEIAMVSTVAFSPSFWAWLLCPVLDVWLSRRAWALALYTVAAACLVAGVLLIARVQLFAGLLTAGCVAAVMAGNAVGGWIPDLVPNAEYDRVGAWFNVANLGAAGLFGTLAVALVRLVPLPVAAGLLGAVLLVPVLLLRWFPPAVRPSRSAAEVFATFFRDLRAVLRTRNSLYGFLCFLLPASSFALTNLFAGMREDFHTSERAVTAIGGLGVALACSLGCLLGVPLCRRFSRRTVYLALGLGGAAVCVGLLQAPRTLPFFAAGVLLYNFFQGVNYTAMAALLFEIVGPRNPLAGTQIALMSALVYAPVSGMTYLDGLGYAHRGISGMLSVDAAVSVAFGVPLLLFFRWAARRDAAVPA